MNTLLLIDSMNLVNRHFHATHRNDAPERTMTAPDGTPVNAIRGCIGSLLQLDEIHQPALTIAVFDHGICAARKAFLPEYKAGREEKHPWLVQQLQLLREEVCPLMGIATIMEENTEADDIIATLAQAWPDDVIVASGDKDLVQCVSQKVTLLRPGKDGRPWDAFTLANAKDILGVEPHQVPDYLAIVGDTTDNIPGLNKAGEKTAQKWLEAYGSLQGIYDNLGDLPPRFKAPLIEERTRLFKTREITAFRDTKTPFPTKPPYQGEKLLEKIAGWNMKSLVSRITASQQLPLLPR